MSESTGGQIDTVMKESRLFPPPKEFAEKARIGSEEEYEKLWKEAAADLEGFWGELAGELHWFRPYDKVLQWDEPVLVDLIADAVYPLAPSSKEGWTSLSGLPLTDYPLIVAEKSDLPLQS